MCGGDRRVGRWIGSRDGALAIASRRHGPGVYSGPRISIRRILAHWVEILAKITSMRVSEGALGLCRSRQISCMSFPPNSDMVLAKGVLRLSPRPATQTPHMPIDRFLHSLAENLHSRSAGGDSIGDGIGRHVGSAGDQGRGGGITFAQDDTARHDGMPRSAIAADCVDHVLAPEEENRRGVATDRKASVVILLRQRTTGKLPKTYRTTFTAGSSA